jgi:membrane-associated phospholipid phosphatase
MILSYRSSLSRRAVLGYGLALGTYRAGAAARALATEATAPAGSRTWLLDAADELRPADPGRPSTGELDEVIELQSRQTAETAAAIAKWADGPAVLPWTGIALDLVRMHRLNPVRAARAFALLHAALHDSVLAVWDARTAYPRLAPSQADGQILSFGDEAALSSSFPSEHAAVAATAAAVLAYLFPTESADGLSALADEAAESRLWAGAAYRSDIDAGIAIGRAVGERAVARGKSDGADAKWDGSDRPATEGSWQPTPPEFRQTPVDPLAGTWATWVLPSGDAYRPSAPPAYGSAAWQAELVAVQEAVARRTPEQAELVRRWAGGPGTVTPGGIWVEIARDLIIREGLDSVHAARVLALTSVAIADAFACCWDAKYTYWTARPITADPDLDVMIATPPFPSYTSGHATASTAAATILAHLFPTDQDNLLAQAAEATNTRLWAGIHFPIDCEVGATGGGMVGRLVVLRAQTDGAEP